MTPAKGGDGICTAGGILLKWSVRAEEMDTITLVTPHADAVKILDPRCYGEALEIFSQLQPLPAGPPDFRKLEKILQVFSQIPYENLSKIIKLKSHFNSHERLRLPGEVLADHLHHSLGGTCFSLTFTLQTILTLSGYDCYSVLADMPWGKNVHCAVVLKQGENKFLLDPGYLVTHPLELAQKPLQTLRTPFNLVELAFNAGSDIYHLYTVAKNKRKWRYCFKDQEVSAQHFLQCWLDSFYWNSLNGICLTRVEEDRIIYIHKTFMRETGIDFHRNHNLKGNLAGTVAGLFLIPAAWVDQAVQAAAENRETKRRLGLWRPGRDRKAGGKGGTG
jgi:arylamine N-acetyltransferase